MPEASVAAALASAQLGQLLLASLAVMGSPGPATISLTAAGSTYGVRRSLAYLGGIVVGTTAVLVAVATGVTAALLAVPGLRPLLVGAGVVYIVWLAYRIATAPSPGAAAAAPAPSYAGGALLGVTNPKAWVAIAAVFASSRLADHAAADAAAKVAVLTPTIVAINTAWLLAGASFARVMRDPRRARRVNVALAATLLAATGLAVGH